LDRQNVKPNRPSLLANGDTRATDRPPGAGRILTDVEQGTSRGATAHHVRRRPLVMMVSAVAVLGALFAWHAFDNVPRPNAMVEASSPSATSSPPPALSNATDTRVVEPASAPTGASDTATTADNPFGGSSAPRATDPNPFGETSGSRLPVKRPSPFAITHASARRPDSAGKPVPTKRVVPVAAATRQRTSTKAVPTPAKTGTEVNETALGNSLLGNIDPNGLVAKVTPPNAVSSVPVSGADHDAIESLIQQVDALQSQASAAAGANGSADMTVAPEKSSSQTKKATPQINHVGDNKSQARTEQLQRDLRRCPQANTASGVDCRIKVCRNYGEKDPACARKH